MNIVNKLKNTKTFWVLFFAVLCVGLFMRGYQYFMNRSLWHDEAHLALNFISHGYEGLTKPLDNWQAAPVLFLFSVETCTRIFGFSEMALRFTPFIISLFTLPVFYFFCYELTKNKRLSLIAFLIFSVNISLVYYASELKPYIIDACMFVIIPWVAITSNAYIAKRRTMLLAIISCLALLFTNTSVIIILVVIVYMMSNWKLEIKNARGKYLVTTIPVRELIMSGIILVVFLFNYFKFIYHHPYSEGMKNEWAFSFWPVNFFSEEFIWYISSRVPDTFYLLLHYTPGFGYVFFFFWVAGIVSTIVTRNKKILLLVIAPILVQIILSMLKLYPFYGRFVINILPASIILFSIGLYACASFLTKKIHAIAGLLIVVPSLLLMTEDSIRHFPKWDINLKPCMEYINRHYPQTPVLVTTPHTMYEFYYKTGFAKNGNYQSIPWNLTADSYFEQEQVKNKSGNYILLHSIIGGDNSDPIVAELGKRGLIVKAYRNNNFEVLEVKPLGQ